MIKETWRTATLEQICLKITDGAHSSPPSQPVGLPMASVKDMTRFGLNLDSARRIGREDFSKLVRQGCMPELGDVLIAKDGATALDTVCEIKKPIEVVLLSSIAIFRPDQEQITSSFLRYYLDAQPTRQYMKGAFISGAAIPRVVLKDFKRVKIFLPPLHRQRRIASILSAYDDLIENNTCRIAILEEMARRLYEEWFVRFHFPGHEQVRMVESELGLIPDGWKISQLSSYGRVVTGKTPSKTNADFFGHDVPFIKTPDMHGNMFCISTGESLSNLGAQSQASKTLPPNSLCVSCIGTAGVVTITSQCAQTNQQINSIVPSDPKAMEFLYFALCGLKETINQYGANGATMTNLNKTKFENLKVISSSKTILDQFHERVASMFDLVKTLQRKNTNLCAQRDLLLPKLISGEIDVSAFPEAEAVAA